MELIEATYAAASDEISWDTLSDRLCATLNAQALSLWCGQRDGAPELLTAPHAPADRIAAYATHYHRTDLWTLRGIDVLARTPSGHPPHVNLSAELISEAEFRASEFHNDFARHLDMFHMVGSMAWLGDGGWYALGCHRPERAAPFSEADRAVLQTLAPHLRRALQLRRRLQVPGQSMSAAALDALATGIVIVDAELRVHLANAAAEAMAAAGILRLLRDGQVTRLSLPHRAEAAALGIHVRAVAARGEAGGGVLLHRPDGGPPVAAMVARLPQRLAPMPAPRTRLAVVLLRETGAAALPSASLLSDLYGLSRAEAAVARAAAAGETAEQIATQRGVGISTVRTQLRIAMEKAEAATLRDLARMLATLAG